MHAITMTVNGTIHRASVDPRTSLADFLRDGLGLTGTHVGCEQGACGACTVLLEGRSVRSCLLFAAQLDGATIETVEGLADGPELSVLQEAFSRHAGLQCGFCTPGFLMAATELLADHDQPSRHQIREALSGNMCRCTGYQGIVDAVHEVATTPRPQPSGAPATDDTGIRA